VLISPFIGIAIDKVGYRRRWMILTAFLFIITHLMFAVLPTP
jgi:MFS family permease